MNDKLLWISVPIPALVAWIVYLLTSDVFRILSIIFVFGGLLYGGLIGLVLVSEESEDEVCTQK